MISPIHQVFAIPELLELILSFLDWRSAIKSQRVCQKWHEAIQQSNSLQCKLGFKASRWSECWKIHLNALNMIESVHRAECNDHGPIIVTDIKTTGLVSSFMMNYVATFLPTAAFGGEYRCAWDDIPRSLLLNKDQNASWRRLQFTQPPTLLVRAGTGMKYKDTLMYRMQTGHRDYENLENDTGVTIGQIIDKFKEFKESSPAHVDWNSEFFSLITPYRVDIDKLRSRIPREAVYRS